MYLIRDAKTVFAKAENPHVVFDKSCGTLLKIGEKQRMESYFEETQDKYRSSGLSNYADDIVLMELPKEQEEIDKVFNHTGYLLSMYEKLVVQK